MGLAGSGNTWARYAVATGIMAAAGVAFLGTAGGGYAYGLSQGTTEPVDFHFFVTNTKEIYSFAFLAVDALAALLPMATAYLVYARWLVPASFVGALAAFFVVLAFTNFFGFLGMSSASAAAVRSKSADSYERLEEKLALLKGQRKWVVEARPAAVIAAALNESEADDLYKRSKSCADITKDDSRAHCNKYRALKTELAAAGQAQALDEQIDAARLGLDRLPKTVKGDFLATIAADLFAFKEDSVLRYRPLAAAVALTLAHSFGMTIAFLVLASGRVQPSSASISTLEVVRPPFVQAPSLIEPPLSTDPLPLESPLPQNPVPEKAKETAIGHGLDAPGRALVPVEAGKADTDTWIEMWAWQVKPGVYWIKDLRVSYGAYVDKKKCPKIDKRQLGAALRRLGFEEFRDRGNGRKNSFRLPKNARIVSNATSARM